MTITVQLTEAEIDALRVLCISSEMRLKADKHANAKDIEFYYNLQDKLLMAKLRAQ